MFIDNNKPRLDYKEHGQDVKMMILRIEFYFKNPSDTILMDFDSDFDLVSERLGLVEGGLGLKPQGLGLGLDWLGLGLVL